MKKVILSSAALSQLLTSFLISDIIWKDENDVEIKLQNGTLSFEDFEPTLNVESTEDWVIKTDYKKLERLNKVLKIIDEQPIVILFTNSNGWINLMNVII